MNRPAVHHRPRRPARFDRRPARPYPRRLFLGPRHRRQPDPARRRRHQRQQQPRGLVRELAPEELLAATTERLIREIGPETFERYRARIVFAVAVDSIECWLLPLYYNDGRRAKTANCLGSLNAADSARDGFSIDPERKQVKYYRKMVAAFRKRKVLDQCAPHNPGFRGFIAQLGPCTAPEPIS